MADLHTDLAVRVRLARMEYPTAVAEELAVLIVKRMSDVDVQRVAAEDLSVEDTLRGSARAAAVEYVRQFIYSVE